MVEEAISCCHHGAQKQGSGSASGSGSGDKAMLAFWQSLPVERRRQLCTVPRRTLFEAIRSRYCSRCFGLFALRYEELRYSNDVPDSEGCPACKACPACQDFFLGLKADGKTVSLEEGMLQGAAGPFEMFAQSKTRERERDLQFMTAGDVCGSGFSARRSGKVCALHTTRVSSETLLAYWNQLPSEHRTALFSLPRHDFEAELDSCCSMQLRICKNCRYNVLAQYKLALSAGRKATGHGRASADSGSSSSPVAAAGGTHGSAMEPAPSPNSDSQPGSAASNVDGGVSSSTALAAVVPAVPLLPVCEGFSLSMTDATVQLVGSDAAMLLEEAEEIEDLKGEDGGEVRHAETPELAQEALLDAVILIFKAQVEVAFREQTAGHNALLLLVALSHELLEERLRNAFLDVHARAAEVKLLELVAEDEKRLAARSSRSRRRKKSGGASGTPAAGGTPAGCASPSQPSVAVQAAAADAAAGGDAADDAAPSTPTKAEERPPKIDSSSAEASPREQTAVSEAASPQLQAASPDLTDLGEWEQQQHEGQSHGEWEVQQRGRKSRRMPRTPGQDGTAASPSPLGTPDSAAMELQSAGQAEPPPPPPPPQQPHSGEQQLAWASVISGAANAPMHDPVAHPAVQAVQQAGSAVWPQLPHTKPQAAPPAVPLPQPVRLRAEPQQQPMAPGPRQPPPGFSQRFSHAMHQHQHPQPQPHASATVSRRSSTEYSLWGEDASSRMPLSLSASRESLASVSDMSFGSPPLAGGLHAGSIGMAGGGHGAVGSGQLPAGCSLFTQQPSGLPLASAMPSLFQHFGQVAAAGAPGGPTKPATSAGGASPSAGDAFSLFSSFPAASRQQANGGGFGAVSSPGSGAMPASFAALFGVSGITGHGMAHTMLA